MIGSGSTPAGANLAFMLYGANQGTQSLTLSSSRNITVNAGNYNVVLGGFTNDYTAISGAITLNGSAAFTANNFGRVDFTGPIGGNGGVLVGNSIPVEGAGTAGIAMNSNGTVVFAGTDTYYGPTNVTSGKFYVNGWLVNSSVFVSNATLGGTGTISSPVNVNSGGISRPDRTAWASSPSPTR